MDPLAGSQWSTPGTVAGFARSAPNAVLMTFAEEQRRRAGSGWVLDLGCGAGRNAVPLARLGWTVVGTDLSWRMLCAAARRAREDRLDDRLHVVLAPMESIPARDRSFDLVIAHGIWNLARSAAQFRRALDEAARVAKPRAGLFLFTFSRNTFPPQTEPAVGEPFVFTQFSGEPQCFLACGGRQPASTSQAGQAPMTQQSATTAGPPLATKNMPPVAGQQKTCAGPREKTFDLDVIETTGVDLGMGFTFAAWAYNGHIPGPTIEACQGDTVTLNVHNKGTISHGLDTHAFKIDARKYGPTPPGTTLTIKKTVETPGVFMYHCSAGPVTDLHIKSGIHGAMIVYPRNEPLRPAREIVVVEDAVYGTPDARGQIPGTDPAKTAKNDQLFSMFNGRLDNEAVRVNPGDLVRMYLVNVGPWTSAAHVIGSVFDRVYAGAPPVQGVQTFAVPAGSGAILEFYIPEAGVFPFVDHDKLAFLPFGLALAFSTEGGVTSVH